MTDSEPMSGGLCTNCLDELAVRDGLCVPCLILAEQVAEMSMEDSDAVDD